VAEHKFRVGQRVTLAAHVNRIAVAAGCVITKQLPQPDGECEYRKKSTAESHERVARESHHYSKRAHREGWNGGRRSDVRVCDDGPRTYWVSTAKRSQLGFDVVE